MPSDEDYKTSAKIFVNSASQSYEKILRLSLPG